MNHVDITLYINEYRLRALSDALGNKTADTVEDKLMEAFDMLYQEHVPDDVRAGIESQIEREDEIERARHEAKRRFAVYHIHENGEDYHFTNDYFKTPMQAAYRYRLYERGELSDDHDSFSDAFAESKPISLEKFDEVCTDVNSDKRVTALMEFNMDDGTVSICDSSDNAWWTYSLRDFSVAAYKAYRAEGRSEENRREIFFNALEGKEIDLTESVPDEDENESPMMLM